MTDKQPSSTPDPDAIDWLGLLQVLADHLRLLVLVPLAAGLLALAYTYTFAPSYSATTKFLPPQQQQSAAAAMLQSLGPLAGAAGGLGAFKNPGDQYVTFLKSQRLQDGMIDAFNLTQRFGTSERAQTRAALAGRSKIVNGQDGLIAVTVTDGEPQFAAQLANGYVQELRNLLKKLAITEAQQRRLFFETQMASAKDNMVKAEQALRASGVSSSSLKLSMAAAIENQAKLKASIAAQEIKLATMRGYLAESAPEFRQALLELNALRTQMRSNEKDESANGTGQGDYLAKYRDFKYHETLFELFAKQYEIARVDESREGSVVQVLDIAEPPTHRNSAKRAQIATVTAVAVGVLLLVWVLLRHALQGACQNPQTAARIGHIQQAVRQAFRIRQG